MKPLLITDKKAHIFLRDNLLDIRSRGRRYCIGVRQVSMLYLRYDCELPLKTVVMLARHFRIVFITSTGRKKLARMRR